ncbi:hypothetical protein LINGRAHAP2_LOCUS23553 [Linum grandiflorum]
MKRYATLGCKFQRMEASVFVKHLPCFGSELKSYLVRKDSGHLVPLLDCDLVGG